MENEIHENEALDYKITKRHYPRTQNENCLEFVFDRDPNLFLRKNKIYIRGSIEVHKDYLVENDVFYPVSFNGKTRFKMSLPINLSQDEIQEEVMNHHKTKIYLKGQSPKRVIIVPNKIVNIVI